MGAAENLADFVTTPKLAVPYRKHYCDIKTL